MPSSSQPPPIDAVEAEIQKLLPRLEDLGFEPTLLRQVVKGDSEAWSKTLDVLYDQGTNFPELEMMTPFLLKLLSTPNHPLTDEILWVLASAREDESSGSKAAAAEGLETYLALLHHESAEVRQPAAFALQTCDRSRIADPIRARVREETDERVQTSMLIALFVPGDTQDLSLFLDILRTASSPRVKLAAALFAVESSPESLPQEAATFLRQRAWEWVDFESWWDSLDSVGRMPFEPSKVLANHGFFWEDGDGAYGDVLNALARLPKENLIRTLLSAAEVELFESALTAEAAGAAEIALSAVRRWLEEPTSGILWDEAREAGSRTTGLLVGALATACGRMKELAAKTCLDALAALKPDIRALVIARIRQSLHC